MTKISYEYGTENPPLQVIAIFSSPKFKTWNLHLLLSLHIRVQISWQCSPCPPWAAGYHTLVICMPRKKKHVCYSTFIYMKYLAWTNPILNNNTTILFKQWLSSDILTLPLVATNKANYISRTDVQNLDSVK